MFVHRWRIGRSRRFRNWRASASASCANDFSSISFPGLTGAIACPANLRWKIKLENIIWPTPIRGRGSIRIFSENYFAFARSGHITRNFDTWKRSKFVEPPFLERHPTKIPFLPRECAKITISERIRWEGESRRESGEIKRRDRTRETSLCTRTRDETHLSRCRAISFT